MAAAKAGSPQTNPVRVHGRLVDQVIESVVDVPILVERIDYLSDRLSPNGDEALGVRRRLLVRCGDSGVAFVPAPVVERQAYEPALAEIGRIGCAEMRLGTGPTVTEQYRGPLLAVAKAGGQKQIRDHPRPFAPDGDLLFHGNASDVLHDAVEAILDVLRGFLVRNDIQLSLADSFLEDSVGNDGRWGGPLHEFLHLFPRLQHFRSRRDLRFVAKIRWPIAPRLVDAGIDPTGT